MCICRIYLLSIFISLLLLPDGCCGAICSYYSIVLTRVQHVYCTGSCCGYHMYQYCCPYLNTTTIVAGALIGTLVAICIIIIVAMLCYQRHCKKRSTIYQEREPSKKFRPKYPPVPERKSRLKSDSDPRTDIPKS